MASIHIQAQVYRGLYVDQFDKIVGDTVQEQELIRWALNHGFNSLSLYDLNKLLKERNNFPLVHDFVVRAKRAGIDQVVAIAGGADSFYNISDFQSRYADGHFDGINLEYEWWVGKSRFEEYQKLFDLLAAHELPAETYLGWLDKGKKRRKQSEYVVSHSEIITLHVYQKRLSAHYVLDRLYALQEAAARKSTSSKIVFIFSMESVFSGPLSKDQDYMEMYEAFMDQLNPYKSDLGFLEFIGFKIFAYSHARNYRD